jgi:hypothetical protein
MATSRRRSSPIGISSKSLDKTSDIVIEEIANDPEEVEELEQPVAKQEAQPLLEIAPIETPPPVPPREVAKPEVAVVHQPPVQQKVAVARHPRNIPKFSKLKG